MKKETYAGSEGWVRPYLRKHKWRLALAVFLGILGVMAAVMLMFISGYLISKAALRPQNIMLLMLPIVTVRALSLGQALFRYLERLVGHDIVLRILSTMRVRLYNILEPQALFVRSRFRTGDMLGMLSDDIEHLQDVYLRTVFPAIVSLTVYGLFIVVLGMFDWTFALLMALYVAVIIFALPLISLRINHQKHLRLKRGRNRLYQKLTDAVLGINDWLVSGRKAEFIESYEASEQELTRTEREVHQWARWREWIIQCVIGVVIVSMIVWAGHQSASGQIAATLIAAFVLMILPIMNAFIPMSDAIERIPKYQDSLARIRDVEHHLDIMVPAETQSQVAASDRQPVKRVKQAHLKIEHVRYRYATTATDTAAAAAATSAAVETVETVLASSTESTATAEAEVSDWVLDDISLDIPQGKKIAIIGRSGAGKSTLLKLIQGALQPDHGAVTVNGTAVHLLGDDVSDVVSVLNQSPHLFDTTVANNIRLSKKHASDEEVREAARKAQLHTLIESLPQGYNTSTHEMGQRFSGGERQRIALARILLQDAPIVILDEPTIGLDSRTENALLATVFEALEHKTLLWITHHLAGVEHMDEVIFIEHGQIAMSGSHAHLLQHSERYRQLYALDMPASLLEA
ncbi:thiol reductant ABC exporter subunit CydC [Paenibacillus sp. 481]|uniref:thiol reductant ABC exporter subunit CydC n=1 Tax=Paenibacillus sp. 481 TaxID=2835869 RepID=UPI001E3060BB|nr:thiol reductant ABC exporter subunit CydC [Paenibacillus sp. 481]UHA73161.1 thiol reductant ABC exporter subunit CydC [Paenibacillus sp. 481]